MGLIKRAKDNYFTLGGIDSRDFDMVVSCDDAFNMPERDVDTYEVPGRNGDLIVDNGRFQNIDIAYDVVIEKDFPEKINAFKRAVGTLRGYVRLEDTFDPDVYRMASVDKVRIEKLGSRYNSGTFAITFNCKPQKFLKSGEEPMVFWTTAVIPSEETASGKDEIHSGIFDFAKISKDISLTISCPAAETILVTYQSLSFDPIEQETSIITTDTITCENGNTIVLNYDPTATCGDFVLTCSDSDTVSAVVHCILSEGLELTEMDIPFAAKYTFANPTGFTARPIIVFGGLINADITLKNYLDDEVEETYSLYAETNVLIERNKTYLDCDSMYMYNENGNNITQQLHITTAIDKTGRSLVFPRFLGENIEIEPHVKSTEFYPGFIPLIWVYPRWWTV